MSSARSCSGCQTSANRSPTLAEVASVHRVSLRELTRPDSPRFVSIPESDRPVVQVPIGGDLIHAPTGAVLYQFRAVAYDGLDTRVDELGTAHVRMALAMRTIKHSAWR